MSTFQNASCSIHLYHEHHYILFGWKAFSVGKFVNLLAKNVMFDTTQLFGGTKYWWLPWIRWNSGVSLHWSFSELQFNFFILVNFFPWPLYSKIYTKILLWLGASGTYPDLVAPSSSRLSKAFLLDSMLPPLLCASGKIKASSDGWCCLHYLLHLFDAILPPTSAAIGNRYFLLYSTSVSRYFLWISKCWVCWPEEQTHVPQMRMFLSLFMYNQHK
jgi:hypothetical protein